MYKLRLFILFMTWCCFTEKACPDVIKTIDNTVIEGEVVNADEEYLSIRQGPDSICFIQWHIIGLISRNNEIIVVSHDGDRKKFSILTASTSNLSAKDIGFKVTDKIQDIYPDELIANRSFSLSESEQSSQGVTNVPLSSPQQHTALQKKTWRGHADAGLTIQKGNKDVLTTNVKTDFSSERTKDNLYFNGLLLFETKDGEKNADEQRGTAKYERKYNKRLYSFCQESIEHDEMEELNIRSISSLGMGYRLIDRENLKYKSEIGPSLTYERFHDDTIQTNPGLRIGNYLDWQILPSTKFYFKADFLPVPLPSELANWRLESDMGLRQSINKTLSWNLSWVNQYDNKPAVDKVSKNDATILSTIGYNF